MPSPFSCSLVIHGWLSKKTQIERKKFWVGNSFLSHFVVALYEMFYRRQFLFKGKAFLLIQLHFQVFWFTGYLIFFCYVYLFLI